jgi:hypothetical protein
MTQRRRVEIEAEEVLADDERAGIVAPHLDDERRLVEAGRHEMVEDEAADIGGGGDLADLALQRVIGGDVAQPFGRADTRYRLHGAVDETFVDQHIGAARRFDECRAEGRVAAEDEALSRRREDEAEGMADRQMIDRDRRHGEIAEAEDLAGGNLGDLDGEGRR